MGFDADKWFNEHVLFHHPFTKTDIDPDDNLKQTIPFLRLASQTPWQPRHSYPITFKGLVGVLLPVGNFFGRRCSPGPMASLLYLHLLPLFFHRPAAGFAIWGLSSVTASVLTLYSFHTTHLMEATERVPYKAGVDWGAHQLHTTANWETNPWSISGGLDLQIEHHLFPYLAYDKQLLIKPLVEQTAHEFGLPYYSFERGVLFAFFWHAVHMVALGNNVDASRLPVTVTHYQHKDEA